MWRDVENGCSSTWLRLWFRLRILSIHVTWHETSHITELECWAVLHHRVCQAWAQGGNTAYSCQVVERVVWRQRLWEQLPESFLSGTWDCVGTSFQGKASISVVNWPVWLCLETNYGYVYTSDLARVQLEYQTHPLETFSSCLVAVQVLEQSRHNRPELSQWNWTRTPALGALPVNYWVLCERYWFLKSTSQL